MARQSTTPVEFNRSTRKDTTVLMSSGRAGVVTPVAYIPLLPGDSASGRIGIDVQLKEMPKPLLNAVHANFQAWFVPKSAHPRFSGRDELMHAWTGEDIKSLGAPDRSPPRYFQFLEGTPRQTALNSTMFTTLGIHVPTGRINTDLIDAFNLIYNFRLAAHSSRLVRRKYAEEDIAEATSLPRAFWPSSRLSRVVPDYERALLLGPLDLDVAAGMLPIGGSGTVTMAPGGSAWTADRMFISGAQPADMLVSSGGTNLLLADGTSVYANGIALNPNGSLEVDVSSMFVDFGATTIGTTLADIDKARTTQAFAKLRTAYAGNDATGFDNDDTIVAHLMQGISVPEDQFKRPWLLDNARVPVGFAERHATDAANLDQSVTLGRASAQLSLNVPQTDVGGVIIVTCEVLPERIDERMGDTWMATHTVARLPNALRDVQRAEPVDLVANWRIDAKHTAPQGLYGYEPMNDEWNRDFTRLGGDFYMETPGGGWTQNRSNIWQTEIVNPVFNDLHYLAPAPFPHTVFADQNADAFEFVARHMVSIVGLTQIGDVLVENNDDYSEISSIKPGTGPGPLK